MDSTKTAADIAASLQASEAASDAAVAQAITDLQALPATPAPTDPAASVTVTKVTLTLSDGSTQEFDPAALPA
jgi:hypothetical protein